MKISIYILTIIYFFVVSIPIFIIIFILTHTFYTLKTTIQCIRKSLTQSQSTSKAI